MAAAAAASGASPSFLGNGELPFKLTFDLAMVLFALTAQFFVNLVHVILVVKARKQYKVEYPWFYAPEGHKNKKEYDSVQRAHANFLENQFGVSVTIVVTALTGNARLAWICGLGWLVGRIMYAVGYALKGPSGRMAGGLTAHLFDLPLVVLALYGSATQAYKLM